MVKLKINFYGQEMANFRGVEKVLASTHVVDSFSMKAERTQVESQSYSCTFEFKLPTGYPWWPVALEIKDILSASKGSNVCISMDKLNSNGNIVYGEFYEYYNGETVRVNTFGPCELI